MTDTPPEDLIAPGRAARILGCHVGTIHRWIGRGWLRAWRRRGERRMVSEAEVRSLLEPTGPRREPLPPTRQERERRQAGAVERLRQLGYDL